MPKNNSLKPKRFPMAIRFGEEPETEFVNSLENIKVKLVQAPSYEEIKKYCIPFSNGTWAENPLAVNDRLKDDMIGDLVMHHVFQRKILPTTLETIRLNFLIDGIALPEVTHILRYRKAVFSAECSGDKWISKKAMNVPTAVENSDEFYSRYKKITEEAKKLYCDMINSKCISVHDARYILPRGIETFYFMSMSLGDAMRFIFDRIDKQIQPQTDNVIAYKMMLEIVNQYPVIVKTLSAKYLHSPARFYVQTARQNRSTNWYRPDADSDIFEWNEKDFVFGDKTRDELLGVDRNRDVFSKILRDTEVTLEAKESVVDTFYGEGFFDQDIPHEVFAEVL